MSRHQKFNGFMLSCACAVHFVLASAISLAGDQAIVISEFRSQGPGGSSDDFIEIYNRTCDTVTLNSWRFRINGINRPTFSVSIPGHGHVLFATPSSNLNWDFLDTFSVTATGCIELLDGGGSRVDAVGTSDGCAHEGDPLPVFSSTIDWAYERKQGGTAGNLQDTDDNLSDFHRIQPSYAENLNSPAVPACNVACDPCDTNCNGTVNQFDIQPFINAVTTHHGCSPCAGDTNGNGTTNIFDINTFIDCLLP